MIHLSRRTLLGAASAMAFAAVVPAMAQTADLGKLMEPPANGEHPLGAETAKVTIIEYASASCPHCAEFNNDVLLPS